MRNWTRLILWVLVTISSKNLKNPIKFPNFDINILNVTAEDDRVHVHLHYTADNLDAKSVHMFVVKDGLQTEFQIFDDSQKLAAALNA